MANTIDLSAIDKQVDYNEILQSPENSGLLSNIKSPVNANYVGNQKLQLDFSGEMELYGDDGKGTTIKQVSDISQTLVDVPTLTFQYTVNIPKKLFRIFGDGREYDISTTDSSDALAAWAASVNGSEVARLIKTAGVRKASRALDLAALHGINPKTGTASTLISTFVDQTRNVITEGATANPTATELENAISLISSTVSPDAILSSPAYKSAIASEKTGNAGYLNPSVGFGKVGDFHGLPITANDTVSPDLAVVGDFANGFSWGLAGLDNFEIFREFANGQELAGKNLYACRVEAYIGWLVRPDFFAVIKKGTTTK